MLYRHSCTTNTAVVDDLEEFELEPNDDVIADAIASPDFSSTYSYSSGDEFDD